MVYFFKSTVIDPPAEIYVGKDKVENEELIKYGWDEDVWFHVDNLSSAHIYLRIPSVPGTTTPVYDWKSIPAALIEDCAQLTKANSIQGNKQENVTIIYTPWANLKKDGSMATGQVSFHDQKKVKRVLVSTRLNAIVNRLTKTRTEIPPGESTQFLSDGKEAHLKAARKASNDVKWARKLEEDRVNREKREAKEKGKRDWDGLVGEDRVRQEGISNEQGFDEDDFM